MSCSFSLGIIDPDVHRWPVATARHRDVGGSMLAARQWCQQRQRMWWQRESWQWRAMAASRSEEHRRCGRFTSTVHKCADVIHAQGVRVCALRSTSKRWRIRLRVRVRRVRRCRVGWYCTITKRTDSATKTPSRHNKIFNCSRAKNPTRSKLEIINAPDDAQRDGCHSLGSRKSWSPF